MIHFRAALPSQEDAHMACFNGIANVFMSAGTTNPRANLFTNSVSIASKMRQTHKRSSPSQSASMWEIKSE